LYKILQNISQNPPVRDNNDAPLIKEKMLTLQKPISLEAPSRPRNTSQPPLVNSVFFKQSTSCMPDPNTLLLSPLSLQTGIAKKMLCYMKDNNYTAGYFRYLDVLVPTVLNRIHAQQFVLICDDLHVGILFLFCQCMLLGSIQYCHDIAYFQHIKPFMQQFLHNVMLYFLNSTANLTMNGNNRQALIEILATILKAMAEQPSPITENPLTSAIKKYETFIKPYIARNMQEAPDNTVSNALHNT
jgi:hypothetical protein